MNILINIFFNKILFWLFGLKNDGNPMKNADNPLRGCLHLILIMND